MTFSLYAIPSPRFTKTAQTVKSLSILAISHSTPSSEGVLSNVNDSTQSKILYLFLINPKTRLTWIRTEIICRDINNININIANATTQCF